MTSSDIGSVIKTLRERHGWTRTELAIKCGFQYQKITFAEHDPGKLKLDEILKIMYVLQAHIKIHTRVTPLQLDFSVLNKVPQETLESIAKDVCERMDKEKPSITIPVSTCECSIKY